MSRLSISVLGTAALIAALPISADWLVMRDGSRVETAGSWEVRGRQVIFTKAGGSLSALRLADVDLEASAAATREGQEAALAEPGTEPDSNTPPKKSVLVLTDADLAPPDIDPDDEEDRDEEATAPPPTGDVDEPVKIVSWEDRESTSVDGLEIVGSIRNTGKWIAASIRIDVKVLEEDNGESRDTQAFLQQSSLAPGGRTTFRALLPGIYSLPEDPSFAVTSDKLTLQGSPQREGERDDDELDDVEDFGDFDDPDDFGGEDLDESDEFEESDEEFEDEPPPRSPR